MRAFAYERPQRIEDALAAIGPDARFLAGGTNLVDLMKGEVERPARLIDLGRLPLAEIRELPDGGIRIGALARNSDCADHPLVRSRFPLLSQAMLSGASPQLRNMATMGGNLLQRTRCPYFYDVAFEACNKRKPGSGCGARDGIHHNHAILGWTEHCIATHPSDLCVALAALDAEVEVRSRGGDRRIPMIHFHRLPGDTPQVDTTLAPDELIVAIELRPNAFAARSHYLKVRDRASYEFALVSVAVALECEPGAGAVPVVRDARIALGGVAHKPWRAIEGERLLAGQALDDATLRHAARVCVAEARPLRDNAWKVPLAERSVARAIATAAGLAP